MSMDGIFGICQPDGRPTDHEQLNGMRLAVPEWDAFDSTILLDGAAGLGHVGMSGALESEHEKLPRVDAARRIVFTASCRVDNRDELLRQFGIGEHFSEVSDSELVFWAYSKWGEDCPSHIYGDWAFAAWHPEERRLFLARDQFGNTSLYYYADTRVFAFASSRRALLALGLASMGMDELYLAQVLVSWPAYNGERTIYKAIKRLPPAHCLTVTPEGITCRQYWRLEGIPELRLPGREDYAEALRNVFDEAVRCRLRSEKDIAVSLSGGLDSGAVAATAAELLKRDNRRLTAFTSVPRWNPDKYIGQRLGNEFPLARAVAKQAGNIDLYPVAADSVTPIQAIRRMLQIMCEPGHGAGNYFWVQAIRETARSHGCRVLLTGATGNAGASWAGSTFSQPLIHQFGLLGWRNWLKEYVKQHAPFPALKAWRAMRMRKDGWRQFSAINPDLANRLNLLDRYLSDRELYLRGLRETRYTILKPGRSLAGCMQAEIAASYGLEVLDPTADVRVLTFTFSVPDRIFIDPETGMDRWLIRAAMKGRLPDEVRLNRQRGRQAADIVPRLRASAGEVEAALNELDAGPAAAYVDAPYMREVWTMIQTNDTPEAFGKSVTVLTRGIMAGLWVNGFYDAS